jgi:hypothetical protein
MEFEEALSRPDSPQYKQLAKTLEDEVRLLKMNQVFIYIIYIYIYFIANFFSIFRLNLHCLIIKH